jgi:putative aldouronate transport system permease protein
MRKIEMVAVKKLGSVAYAFSVYFGLILFALLTVVPFIYVISGSFATSAELNEKGFLLFPTTFTLDAYRYIFSTNSLLHSLGVTVLITALGTFISILFSCMTAYPLARRDYPGRGVMIRLILFTMLFSGGIIPTFLIVKGVGLINTYWALVIPGAISAFNLIILKNFFQNLPDGLEESAKMDGATDWTIFFRIVVPLSLPAIATFSLFYAVENWNKYFDAILYINDSRMWPIQVLLRQIVLMSQGGAGDSTQFDPGYVIPPDQTVKMAVIVVATLPILIVYPFLQKHFAKGALMGSVKG